MRTALEIIPLPRYANRVMLYAAMHPIVTLMKVELKATIKLFFANVRNGVNLITFVKNSNVTFLGHKRGGRANNSSNVRKAEENR